MTIQTLLAILSQPSSYAEPAADLRIVQTHISVVVLTDQHAYKIKKPVKLDFLDFSTPENRRHFCEEEVRLNRRLAPDVHLGVVPVTAAGIEKASEPVDWAVKMRRLPDDATFQKRLGGDEIKEADLQNLAQRLADFHAKAARGPEISGFGSFEIVAGNARDNFAQAKGVVCNAVSAGVFDRLRHLTDETLEKLEAVITGGSLMRGSC